jgi:hypothetical protein
VFVFIRVCSSVVYHVLVLYIIFMLWAAHFSLVCSFLQVFVAVVRRAVPRPVAAVQVLRATEPNTALAAPIPGMPVSGSPGMPVAGSPDPL